MQCKSGSLILNDDISLNHLQLSITILVQNYISFKKFVSFSIFFFFKSKFIFSHQLHIPIFPGTPRWRGWRAGSASCCPWRSPSGYRDGGGESGVTPSWLDHHHPVLQMNDIYLDFLSGLVLAQFLHHSDQLWKILFLSIKPYKEGALGWGMEPKKYTYFFSI